MEREMELRGWQGMAFSGRKRDGRKPEDRSTVLAEDRGDCEGEENTPGAEAGYLQEGVKAVFDFPHTADLRDYDSIVFRTGPVGREDMWLDVMLYPLRSGRPEFVEKVSASVCLPAGGGICRIPFTAFDHSRLVRAHMKYIDRAKVILRREGDEQPADPIPVRIDRIAFSGGTGFQARAVCVSQSGEPGQRLTWKAVLENGTDRELLLNVSENRSGRESFPLEYEKKIRLVPGESRETEISGVLPEEIAPGGHEARVLQWVPCGEDFPEQSITFYAGRKPAHPFLLHKEEAWDYLKALLGRDAGLARRFEEEYGKEAESFRAPEPAEDRGYVYVSETQNSFLKTAIAWKLTGKDSYLEQLLTYFRGFLDEKSGYLSTEYPYFQFIRSEEEWKKGAGDCPFPVHRSCSAGWVQEGEFMTKMAFVYDLLYDRAEFTGQMHRGMELCMRAYMDFEDWRLTDGDGNNFQLAEASAALYFACLLQDYPRIERFLAGSNGLYELMGSVFSDDGSYFEGATNYVRLAAEILLHAANACENFGLNLKDAAVPAFYDRNILHAPWARRQEWAADGKPFLGMNFERFVPNRRPVRKLKEFIDQITTLLTPEGILFSVNDSNEQSLIPILDLAYYLYEDRACQAFCDPKQEGEFLFGPYMADWKRAEREKRQGRGRGSRLVEGGGFAILRESGEHFCQVVMKYGQHGGYHGHYDRLSLVSFIRDNKTFHNQEFAWFGYDSFLFKMWVQASVAHNMVVVDGKMQEPAPCECIYFEEGKDFSAVCGQTMCRWSDPPYGGQTPYPLEFPGEKCEKEGRYILPPAAPREQGEIGDYTGPVFQRRLMALLEGCLFVWDYLEAEEEHAFDCLWHPFGSVEAEGLRYEAYKERFDENPFGAGQFVTDCHWYEGEGTVKLHFSNQRKRVNANDRIDFVEQVQLFGVYPQAGKVMLGRYPEKTAHFQKVEVCPKEIFLSSPCRKTVSFHQKGRSARFVTALEIGEGKGRIRDIRCESYGSILVEFWDGSIRHITVEGMEEQGKKTIGLNVK